MSETLLTQDELKEIAEDLFQWIYSRFKYGSDWEVYGVPEDWRSCLQALEAGANLFVDYCDGRAATSASKAIKRCGVPPSQVKLIFCLTEDGGSHLVCGIGNWIIDNRQLRVVHWSDLQYTWLYKRKMSEDKWRTWG